MGHLIKEYQTLDYQSKNSYKSNEISYSNSNTNIETEEEKAKKIIIQQTTYTYYYYYYICTNKR